MSSTVERLVASWDDVIPAAMRRNDVPGLAIGICDANGTLWTRGYGRTRRDGGMAVTPSTRFSVQSTSKLVTATLALRAVQLGLVELDAPARQYLPEFTVRSAFEAAPHERITLRHLLNHTAGLTHDAPIGSNFDVGSGSWADHCASINRTWLRCSVGHHFEYSNLGIDLAGLILERVWQAPFAELAALELFMPLQMTRSTFDAQVMAADPQRAVGHWTPFDRAQRELPVEVPMIPAGGLYTTVEDALRFLRLHLRRGVPVLTSAVLGSQYVVSPVDPRQRLGYALGVYVDEWAAGTRVLHHGGSGWGYQTQLCWLPDAGLGLVVLTNSFDHDLQNELARAFAEHVAQREGLPRASPPEHRSGANEAGDVSGLAGHYVGRLGDLTLRVQGERLVAVRDGQELEAAVTAPHTIQLADERGRLLVARPGRAGTATYLCDLHDGQTYYRNEAVDTPASELPPQYAGSYAASLCGVEVARFALWQDGASPVIRRGDEADLRLSPVDETHYLSSDGEILDLTQPGVTYANVALTRVGDALPTAAGSRRSSVRGAVSAPQ